MKIPTGVVAGMGPPLYWVVSALNIVNTFLAAARSGGGDLRNRRIPSGPRRSPKELSGNCFQLSRVDVPRAGSWLLLQFALILPSAPISMGLVQSI